MRMLRVLVCDDEPLAVRRMARVLKDTMDVEIVATAGSGQEAIDATLAHRPDLLLLDIEMPEVDGFDVVEGIARLRLEIVPLVAFVTAFRRFAPQAFDIGAIDFLPKPVRSNRLETTLQRARSAMRGQQAGRRLTELEAMLARLRSDGGTPIGPHVWVARRGEVVRVEIDRVDRIEAEGAYVRLYADGTSYLHREPIKEIELRLDQLRFARVHRSHIVRLDRVSSIRRTIHGGSELLLRDGHLVPLGRKYVSAARSRLIYSETEPTPPGGAFGG